MGRARSWYMYAMALQHDEYSLLITDDLRLHRWMLSVAGWKLVLSEVRKGDAGRCRRHGVLIRLLENLLHKSNGRSDWKQCHYIYFITTTACTMQSLVPSCFSFS